MSRAVGLLIEMMNAEFDGDCFNGPPLMQTLQALTLEQALDTETYEGYSAWGIVLHLAYWKDAIARGLGGAELAPFPYEASNWPALPEEATAEGWRELLEVLAVTHRELVAAIASYTDEALEARDPEWNVRYGKVISWIATHDTYHTAQIRNMGLRGLPVNRP